MRNNDLYIASIDGKDLYLANNAIHDTQSGYSLRTKTGELNTRKFINTLNYSLEQIKLRELYEKVYRRRNFSATIGKKEYITHVINVTFKYAVKEFNRIRSNTYVRNGWHFDDVAEKIHDSVYIADG